MSDPTCYVDPSGSEKGSHRKRFCLKGSSARPARLKLAIFSSHQTLKPLQLSCVTA
jgi:hypothetical protein